MPFSVTKIEDYAFCNCNKLTLEVEHTSPLEINENVFQSLRNSTLRVPISSKSAYASATGWSKFDNIFEGDEGTIFTAKTDEGIEMAFTILDDNSKTCQVGYVDDSKSAVDINSVLVEIPASVTSIGNNAIYRFDSATSIKVAEGNPNYDSRDNCNAIIETATNKLLFGFKVTTIPATVTEIGEYAFGLYSTYTLTIPSTITKICDNAFIANINLTLQVEHTTPLVINDNVFKSLTNCTLRVPVGTKSLYLAADGWKNFGEENIIEMSGEKKGDVTGDGIVSVADVVAIISYVLGENPSDFNAVAADVNGDGKVTVADVVAVIDIISSN